MALIVLALILGIAVIFLKGKEYFDLKKIYEEILANKKYEKFDSRKQSYFIYSFLMFLGIISAVTGFMTKEYSTAVMGIVIILMIASELFTLQYKNIFYYNDSNFIVSGKVLRYKSIKSIDEGGKLPFSSSFVTTLNNEKHQITKAFAKKLKELK